MLVYMHDEPDSIESASAVKQIREKLGDTQEAFARRLGTTLRSITRYESNRIPTPEVMSRLIFLAADNKLLEEAEVLQRAFRERTGANFPQQPRGRPLTAHEYYLDQAFRRVVFERPDTLESKKIRKLLEPVVAEIMAEWTESIVGLKNLAPKKR
jgi:transcriptional regulator with XRE-family HTH domain